LDLIFHSQTTGQSEEPEPETRLATDPHETTAQVQTTRQTETDIRESLPGSEATSGKGTSPLLWLIPLIVLVLATAGGLVWFFVIRRNHKKDSSLPGE
jgi:uncharacterized protein HemX